MRRKGNFGRMVLGCLSAAALILTGSHAAFGLPPVDLAREFLQVDGQGHRLRRINWHQRVGGLVQWQLEPAWDHVFIIRGFEIGNVAVEPDLAKIDVTYTLSGEVKGGVLDPTPRLETRQLLVGFDGADKEWRILGPPPVPAVFESSMDRDAFVASFDPSTGAFLTNSAFVWRKLRALNSKLEYRATADLAEMPGFEVVDTPRSGDVAVISSQDGPYHAGFVRAEEQIESATLNYGVRVAPIGEFAGTVQYLRRKKTAKESATEKPGASSGSTKAKKNPSTTKGTKSTKGK